MFSESYAYDAVGNRTDNGAGYNPGNRLTGVSWALFVYDADGNVTSRTNTATNQLMQFYWDAGSQMDSVLVSGGGQASYRVDYRYDGYGRLIWRAATGSFPSTQRLYLYGAGSGGSNIGKEIDLVTGHTTEYEYAGVDHPTMSVTRDSTGTVLVSRTFMMDGLGNVVGSSLDGSSGAVIIYDSWGNVETDSTAMMRLNTLRFGFKGMLYDETTGLYNARARWYQPDVGRFMSEDPIGLSGGMNQYVFAGDDPINNSDPSGALVTDAHGGVCSINASSCGDPLQFPGGAGYGAVLFALAGGPTGGDVSYASAPVAYGLIIVDKSIRDALAGYRQDHAGVDAYMKTLESSQWLYAIADADLHGLRGVVVNGGTTFGGPGVGGISEQDFVDTYAGSLGLAGVRGLSLISSIWAAAHGVPIAVIAAHEAIHLLGLEVRGIKYGHRDAPFQNDEGCRVYLNCGGQP